MCALVIAGVAATAATGVSALTVRAHVAATICGAKAASQVAAPGLGQALAVPAAGAGVVTLVESTYTVLQVRSVAPAPHWTDQVVIPVAHKVHVTCTGATPAHQVRFFARLDGLTGTTITVITVTCT